MVEVNREQQRFFELMDAIRFPLILLVVFIHVLPGTLRQVPIPLHVGNGYYLLVSEFISHSVGRIAVPAFFVLSGYFFFLKMSEWSAAFYWRQLSKRSKTVLLPYIAWNLIALLAVAVKFELFERLGIAQSELTQPLEHVSIYHALWEGPADYPLWYMRDLICMVLLSPLFYYLFRYLKAIGLLLLYLLYLSCLPIHIPGLSTTAIFYFGAGAFLGLRGLYKLPQWSVVQKVLLGIVAIGLPCLCTLIYGRSPYYEFLERIYIPFGILALAMLLDRCMELGWLRRRLLHLSRYVFFIYVVHSILIINWLKGASDRVYFFSSVQAGMLLAYFIIPIITIFVCIAIYKVWEKLSPRSLSILVGGRL